jgi:hypothetical protein
MMSRCEGRILEIGQLVWKLCAIAVGCFVFMRGFRLIASEEESSVGSSILVDGAPGKSWAGIGVPLLLLTFVTNEAVMMIQALCR